VFACLYGDSPRLAELARQFSPLVESVTADAVVFSITGLDRLIGDAHQIASAISRRGAEMGLAANLAIASNPAAAVLAARNIAGVTIIPPGKEADVLAFLPIEALPATPELHSTLSRWGIDRLGDLAALPEIGLVERLGEEGTQLRLLAQLHEKLHAVRFETGGQGVVGNQEERPPPGLCMQNCAFRSESGFGKRGRPKPVVGGGLAVEVFAICDGDFFVVRDDLVVARTLQEEDITQWNVGQMLQARPGLDRLFQIEFLLVDEDLDLVFVLHGELLRFLDDRFAIGKSVAATQS
jgi:hypothetical protein